MFMVMQDASEESLDQDVPATPSQASTAQLQDSEHGSGPGSPRVSFQDEGGVVELEPMLASVHPPSLQPTQISLLGQVPQQLIVAQPVQDITSEQQQQRQQRQSRPPSQTGQIIHLDHLDQSQFPSEQQRSTRHSQIPPAGAPAQPLNPRTDRVIRQETGQDPSAQSRQVLLPQTGQVIPGQVVTSIEGQIAVTLQASNQEEDTNIVSSTLNSVDRVVGASKGGMKAETIKRELKYRRKYQASMVESSKVKFQLLERERQLQLAEQEIKELKKRQENLSKWENRSRQNMQGDSEQIKPRRRGMV